MEPIFNHNWETSNGISFSLSQQKNLQLQIKSRAKVDVICKYVSPFSEVFKMKNSLKNSKTYLGGALYNLLKCAEPGFQSGNICKVVFVQSVVSC